MLRAGIQTLCLAVNRAKVTIILLRSWDELSNAMLKLNSKGIFFTKTFTLQYNHFNTSFSSCWNVLKQKWWIIVSVDIPLGFTEKCYLLNFDILNRMYKSHIHVQRRLCQHSHNEITDAFQIFITLISPLLVVVVVVVAFICSSSHRRVNAIILAFYRLENII